MLIETPLSIPNILSRFENRTPLLSQYLSHLLSLVEPNREVHMLYYHLHQLWRSHPEAALLCDNGSLLVLLPWGHVDRRNGGDEGSTGNSARIPR